MVSNFILTIILAIVIVGVPWILQKRVGFSTTEINTEEELQNIQQQREKIKIKQKQENIIKKKLINGYMIVATMWMPFYVLFMRPSLRTEGIQTWLTDILTVVSFGIVVVIVSHGAILQLGTQAMRIKEIGIDGVTRVYNIFVKNRMALEPAFIRESLKVWEETGEELSIEQMQERYVSASEAVKATGDFYDLEFEAQGVQRQVLVPKERVKFLKKMSVIDFDKVKKLVDDVLSRRFGNEKANIPGLVADAMSNRMESLSFRENDSQMFRYMVEGIKEEKDEKHKEKLKALIEWFLVDRLHFPEEQVEALIEEALPEGKKLEDAILKKIEPIQRTVKDGIMWGGFHAEMIELGQYDTPWAIVVMPYPWTQSFKFNYRDWIDSSNVPFPMFCTDVTWRVLHTLIIQTAPKEFEYCKVVMPVWTDHDLQVTKGLVTPHVIDNITARELAYFFQEKSADVLLEKYIETESKLQRRERFAEQEKKTLGKQLRRLWVEFRAEKFQGLRAMWQYATIGAVGGMFLGWILTRIGVFAV